MGNFFYELNVRQTVYYLPLSFNSPKKEGKENLGSTFFVAQNAQMFLTCLISVCNSSNVWFQKHIKYMTFT